MNDPLVLWARKVASFMVLDSAIPQNRREFSISLPDWLRRRSIDPAAVSIENARVVGDKVVFEAACSPKTSLVEMAQIRVEFAELPPGQVPDAAQLGARLATAFPGLVPDTVRYVGAVGPDGFAILDLAKPNILLAPGSTAQVLLLIDMMRGRARSGDPVAEARAEGAQEIARLREAGALPEELAELQRLHERRVALLSDAMKPRRPQVVDRTSPLASAILGDGAMSREAVEQAVESAIDNKIAINASDLFGLAAGDLRSLGLAFRTGLPDGLTLGAVVESVLIRHGFEPLDGEGWHWGVPAKLVPEPRPWWRIEGMPVSVLRIDEESPGRPVASLPWNAPDSVLATVGAALAGKKPPAEVRRERCWGVFLGERLKTGGLSQTEAEAAAGKIEGATAAHYQPTDAKGGIS